MFVKYVQKNVRKICSKKVRKTKNEEQIRFETGL